MNNKLKQTAKHVIFISYDAFSEDNWQKAKSLPNLSKLIKNGAYTSKLKSIYPTLTYVVHTTYVTGVYPDKHGIVHNNPLQPFTRGKSQEWYWYRDKIKTPTIYDIVKENNMKTAGILWPVSGKSSIKYNIPEVKAINNENQVVKMLKNGSLFYVINMGLKYGKELNGSINQPYLDNFSTLCGIDTIKHKKPNLLLLHLIDLDDTKHRHGTLGPEIDTTIKRMDERLGNIIKSVYDAGIEKDTVFVISGDHGHLDVNYKVHLNNLFKDQGLIYEKNGQEEWRASLQPTGGSAYLYIREGDKEAEALALETLTKAKDSGKYGIEKIYTRNELDKYHVQKQVSYMIEAKKGYCFEESLSKETIVDLREKGIKYATHGYSPDKEGYRTNLVVSGPIIKNNYEINNIEMVDIAPTIASILGIDFPECDGRVVEEIFI